MLEENAELRVVLWVNGGLEHWQEDILQHLSKVRHKVSASEDITVMEEKICHAKIRTTKQKG